MVLGRFTMFCTHEFAWESLFRICWDISPVTHHALSSFSFTFFLFCFLNHYVDVYQPCLHCAECVVDGSHHYSFSIWTGIGRVSHMCLGAFPDWIITSDGDKLLIQEVYVSFAIIVRNCLPAPWKYVSSMLHFSQKCCTIVTCHLFICKCLHSLLSFPWLGANCCSPSLSFPWLLM